VSAFAERRARGSRRSIGVAARIARNQCQPISTGFEQRQLCRVENGLAKFGIGSGQRDKQCDLFRSRRSRGRGPLSLARWCRRRMLAEIWGLRRGDRRRYHWWRTIGERDDGRGCEQ